jgi:hypothetical protein
MSYKAVEGVRIIRAVNVLLDKVAKGEGTLEETIEAMELAWVFIDYLDTPAEDSTILRKYISLYERVKA